jgi:regulatory protein
LKPPVSGAYLAALRLLARRELSEAQVRQRLARRQHEPDDIDAAVARLRAEGSLDDSRTAGAIARHETTIRRRGRRRVIRQIEAAGIAPDLARQATDETFADLDPDALLAAALESRLRGRAEVADEREHGRLYRYLVGQGFEPDRVLAALAARRARR